MWPKDDTCGGGAVVGRRLLRGSTVVTLAGELDIAEVLELRHELTRMPTASLPNVVVDLTQVRFMDCSVLRTLVSAHLQARTQGGCLRLVAPQSEPLHLLKISRLDRVFCLHDTLPAAADPVCARHLVLC